MGDGFNRREVLGALGAGMTGILAGCNEALEPEGSEKPDGQSNNQGNEPLNIRIGQAENANLSNVDPRSTEPETYGLAFSADAAEADANLTIQLTNGIQTQTYEASTSDLQVINDQVSILNIPENLLVHGDTKISATFTGENQEGTLDTEMNTQTPQAFPIDRRVEGQQASNFETPWAFAQHDLDREAARQAHLDYVNNNEDFVRDFNSTNYAERIDQVSSSSNMQELLNKAAHVAMDVELDQSLGTNQSGNTIGFTTSYVASEFNELMDQEQLYTMIVTDPENSTDGIYHWDKETGKLYFQDTTRVSDDQDNLVVEFNPDEIGETTYDKSTILGFEPGFVDGIDDDDASRKTYSAMNSIMTMANQERISTSNYVMNDHFLAEASDQIFEEGNIQAVNDIASAAAEMAIATDQLTFQEAREPGDEMPARQATLENGKIAVYIDEDESIEDATLAYVQDENLGSNLYDRVVETAEPAGRNEIEEMAGLN